MSLKRLALLLLLAIPTCAQVVKIGGGALSSGASAPGITISVNPSLATVTVSTMQAFTVTLIGDTQNAGAFWTLQGPACLGATCGTISNSTSINGASTTYTAPSVVPTNPTIFLTVASVTDPTKFATATITVFQGSGGGGGGGSTPAPMSLNNRTPLSAQFNPAVASGATAFNFTPLQGTLLDVYVYIPVSGASVSGITDPSGDVFTKGSCDADISPAGHVAVFNAFSAKIGTSSITVNWSSGGPLTTGIGVIIRDISNNSNVNQANVTCGGSAVATQTPSGPAVVAASGSLVISGIQTESPGAQVFTGVIPPPFTVSTAVPNYTSAGGTDLTAATGGTYSPNWQLTQISTWAGITESFSSGSSGGGGGGSNITVALSPASVSLGTSGTQTFTATVSNDSSNSGVTYTLTGAGCSGATCGTINTGSTITQANTFTTCGNTATPTMTCTLGASSLGNLLVLQSGGGGANVITKVVDNKNNTWVQGPAPTSNGCVNTSDNDRVQEWHAVGAVPGVTSLTITVSPTGGSLFGFQELHMYDLAGADPASPLISADCVNNGTSSTTFAAPSETATLGGGALISGVQAANGASSVDSPFTYDDNHVAHYLNTSPGTFTPTFHAGTPGTWTAFTSAFKPSSIATGSVLYTAPGSAPSPNTVTLIATSVKDPTKTASATITIGGSPVIGVSVTPPNATLVAGAGTQNFTATVVNDSLGVNWTLSQNGVTCSNGCGSLASSTTASGAANLYTPPTSVTANTSITVQACSITLSTACGSAIALITPSVGPPQCGSPCPAFPGAQGPGALAVGGRGGVVYNITTLAYGTNSQCVPFNPDTVTCSLLDCVNATGARNCIFRISGYFTNTGQLQINHPLITVAGQTAPGGPITLHSGTQAAGTCPGGDCRTMFVAASDVILRYLTYDGISIGQTGPDTGTVGFEYMTGANRVINDHSTRRWWGNKPDVTNTNGSPAVQNITVQWGLFFEPNIAHPVIMEWDTTCPAPGCSALAGVNQAFHHNMGVNFNHRWVLTNIHSMTFQNNIAYNYGAESNDFLGLSWGGIVIDYIGNKSVPGPQTVAPMHPFLFQSDPCSDDESDSCPSDNPGPPSIYLLNNIGPTNCSATVTNSCTSHSLNAATHVANDQANKNQAYQGWEGGETLPGNHVVAPIPGGWYRSTPQAAYTFPITQDSAENLDNILLPTIGNSQHLDCLGNFVNNRDSQDTRIISQYLAATGGAPIGTTNGGVDSSPNYNGPTVNNGANPSPTIAPGTACVETLHDGIPDAWRSRYGISRAGSAVDPATGYTTLEEYLDGIVPSP